MSMKHPRAVGLRQRLMRVRVRPRRLVARGSSPDRRRECQEHGAGREPAAPERLQVRAEYSRPVTRVELFGDLSPATCARLADCLDQALESDAERIVLDLSGLDRLDPAAVGTILLAHLCAVADHRQFILVPARGTVQRVVERVEGPFDYLARQSRSAGYSAR